MSDAEIVIAARDVAVSAATTASEAADFAAEKAVEVNADRVAAQAAKTDAQAAAAAAGAQMWVGGEAVTTATVRQAPDGSRIRSNAARTTRATFDPTEQGFWTPVLSTAGTLEQVALSATFVPKALTTNPVPNSTTLRTMTGPRTAVWRESFARGNVTEGATTLENMTWGWGFNMAPNYTKEVATEPMLRIGMESSWLNAGNTYTEYHLAYRDPSATGTSGGEVRVFSFDVKHGGDGGKGSPRASMTVTETDASGGFTMYAVGDGSQLVALSPSGWAFKRNTAVQRGATAASLFTIGDALHNASFVMNAKAAAGVNQIEFQRGGTSNWLLYDAGNNTDLYLRDTINGRTHVDFIRGASVTAAFTDFYSNIRALGNEIHAGPAANKAVIGALSGVEAWFDAQGSNTNIGVSIRAKGTGVIKALSAFQAQGNIGFYNATPVAKPTISGSRGGNAALASLLTALASQGLLTDSSTA